MLRTLFAAMALTAAGWSSAGGHGHSGHCSSCAGHCGKAPVFHGHGHGHIPHACIPSDLKGMHPKHAQRALRDPCYWTQPWHGEFYHTAYGVPVAMVVPPTASMQTDYSWGVGGFRVQPLYRQFNREYPGPVGGGGFLPTPKWPSDTAQFGVYPVRGPW